MNVASQFDGVSVVVKANVYFEGRVVSHTLLFPDGSKKTLGLIYPGVFTFNTGKAERMEIVAGSCEVRLKDQTEWTSYAVGTYFDVPANSAFDIRVDGGVTEYICSFL
ncbi:MAG TPA: pyrimidine/purine nucleoside phosphorylase [Kiritimatiellia bacterium]|nr:pyrimidine/purine nucleoside phosphorylase [Kiritimatiellia bacterium]